MASIKNILDELPVGKKKTLANLFETEGYTVLKDVMILLRENAGMQALNAQNIEELKHLQGQAHGLKMLHFNIKELHKTMSKD